jgi:MbtH protein
MVSNPFDDQDGRFLVLRNDEEQFSLWPTFAAVPGGWSVVLEESSHSDALDYVEQQWTDMRPKSLRLRMDSPSR